MLLVDDVDDREYLVKLFEAMYDELPERKKKQNVIFEPAGVGTRWSIQKIHCLWQCMNIQVPVRMIG